MGLAAHYIHLIGVLRTPITLGVKGAKPPYIKPKEFPSGPLL